MKRLSALLLIPALLLSGCANEAPALSEAPVTRETVVTQSFMAVTDYYYLLDLESNIVYDITASLAAELKDGDIALLNYVKGSTGDGIAAQMPTIDEVIGWEKADINSAFESITLSCVNRTFDTDSPLGEYMIGMAYNDTVSGKGNIIYRSGNDYCVLTSDNERLTYSDLRQIDNVFLLCAKELSDDAAAAILTGGKLSTDNSVFLIGGVDFGIQSCSFDAYMTESADSYRCIVRSYDDFCDILDKYALPDGAQERLNDFVNDDYAAIVISGDINYSAIPPLQLTPDNTLELAPGDETAQLVVIGIPPELKRVVAII